MRGDPQQAACHRTINVNTEPVLGQLLVTVLEKRGQRAKPSNGMPPRTVELPPKVTQAAAGNLETKPANQLNHTYTYGYM